MKLGFHPKEFTRVIHNPVKNDHNHLYSSEKKMAYGFPLKVLKVLKNVPKSCKYKYGQ